MHAYIHAKHRKIIAYKTIRKEGGVPLSSIMRCHRANFLRSDLEASLKLLTGPSAKKKPNMPEMLPPVTAWPYSFPAARIPLTSLEVIFSRCW